MEKKSVRGERTMPFGDTCQVVHVNAHNYAGLKARASKNRIMSSFFTSLEDEVKPCGLGLKYAAEGQERYFLDGRAYSVSSDKYLLVNESIPSLDVAIKGKSTWSVCIDMDEALVNDLLLQQLQPNELDNYTEISRYLLTPELFVREVQAEESLKVYLQNIIRASASNSIERPAIELIYDLIGFILQGNKATIHSYYKLQTIKLSTRKELFRRLLVGKEVLEAHVYSPLCMKQVAEECCMSEFRFYRLFRQCFGDSPYNYLFKKRIEESVMLNKQGMNWVEIASLLNFTDLAAFSKGFKKVMGVSPTKAVL
ncbi:helix-turn-helix domain-containing protein [Pontibacter sp. MBLB2868]|uniref:helix-turn-helix domain-containing protein n=1 Tax=Pontibacter sp. MBLB2868 TaxID=3451555 RepID=UPI003F7518D4